MNDEDEMSSGIGRGDFYEDCGFRPMLCVTADYSLEKDELLGLCLIPSMPGIGSCSPRHCGPTRLTADEAIDRALNWQRYSEVEIPKRAAEIDALVRLRGEDPQSGK